MGLRETVIRGCPVEDAVEDCLADEMGGKRSGTLRLKLVVVDGSLWWWVDSGGGGVVLVWNI